MAGFFPLRFAPPALFFFLLTPLLLMGCSSSDEADDLFKPSDRPPDAGQDTSPAQDAEPEEPDVAPDQQVDVVATLGMLVVDSNRNGILEPDSFEEQAFKDQWDESHGAIFLANIDDDDEDGVADGLDDFVNGPADALDLARIRVVGMKEVPSGAVGTLFVDPKSAPWVRLFRVQADEFLVQDPTNITLSSEDLEKGVEFGIEGIFFPTSLDPEQWSGFVDIESQVRMGEEELARDRVRMRVAPLVFMHNLMKTDQIWVGGFDNQFVQGVKNAASATQTPVQVLNYNHPGYANNDHDPWTQDHFEMGYTAMPSPDGLQMMKVAFRTPRVKRTSADIVFVEFLGPDFGAVHIHSTPYDNATRSLDSTGNWETVPPHEAKGISYPHGRFILGSTPERHPDPVAEEFVQAQRIQPLIRVDTSWLAVGHVDEILSFVKTDNARGWQLLFARPSLAVHMLEELKEQGHDSARMHEGKWWWSGPATRTVNQVLGSASLMAANQESQAILDGILIQLIDELDLSDDEITDIPFLSYSSTDGMLAYQPGTVNLLYFDGHVLIADPFGPKVNGKDVFKEDLDTRLGALGLVTHYVDDWDTYHRNDGEVHCGTNSLRIVPTDDAWWEDGR